MSVPISRKETVYGWIYLAIELFLLPGILLSGNQMLGELLSEAELNFLYFVINFLSAALIFHSFLHRSVEKIFKNAKSFLKAVILGFLLYLAYSLVFGLIIHKIYPDFQNLNDQAVGQMLESSRLLMVIGTVILVPPVEECFYRGLLFRNFYEKNPLLAAILSSLAFAAIHLISFLGILSPAELTVSLLQYVPAALLLCWSCG